MYGRRGRADPRQAAAMDDEARAQFEQLGVTILPDEDEDRNEGFTAIMSCNWPSFEAFIACATQWRVVSETYGGMAGIMTRLTWIGLDYAACSIVLQPRALPAYVFDDLRACEDAALPILNEVE